MSRVSRVDTAAETKKTAVTEDLNFTREQLAVTAGQRDEATATIKTMSKISKQQKKNIHALKGENAALHKVHIESGDKARVCEARLFKARAEHSSTKCVLRHAEEKSVVLTATLADVTADRDSVSKHLQQETSKSRVLAERLAVAENGLRIAEKKAAAKDAQLSHQVERKAVLAERLAKSIKQRIIAKTKLREAKLDIGALTQSRAACIEGLDAASEELAAKDAMIVVRDHKIDDIMLVVTDQGNANLKLVRSLNESRAELEVSELSTAICTLFRGSLH